MKKVTFIHHSAFMIELQHHVLLFDYFQGELPSWPKEKPLYVFSSHAHGDHFSPSIFQLPAQAYILGFDQPLMQHVHVMNAHEHKQIDDLDIHAFFSTDEGVAFLVECEGERIYHAGDLHYWHWMDDDEEQTQWMKRHYEAEMKRLASFEPTIAFVVLDPRLEENKEEGMDIFYSYIQAKAVFPMHLWGDFELAKMYKKNHGYANFYVYGHDGMQFQLK